MYNIDKYKNNHEKVQIIKYEKKILDHRYNIIDKEHCSPKYYFADAKGNRLSNDYYSIVALNDGIHYIISELDFMYSLGLADWELYCGSNEINDYYFRFHYGVVSVIDNKIIEIVPAVYKEIRETNGNIIFVKCDEKYKASTVNSEGCVNFGKIDSKIGCINLDINSNNYGMSIIPPIMDKICDFNLKYKGFAYASIAEYEGYLSKEIDVDNYNEILNLYLNLKKGNITSKEYLSNMSHAVSKILLSEDDVKKITKKAEGYQLKKKNVNFL